MEIDNLWKAEKWDPEKIDASFISAPARNTSSLSPITTINFDAYDSKYHAWNSVNVGPKRDIARQPGRKSLAPMACVSASAITRPMRGHWFQAAYGLRWRRPAGGRALRCLQSHQQRTAREKWVGRTRSAGTLYRAAILSFPMASQGAKAVAEWHEKNRPGVERESPTDESGVHRKMVSALSGPRSTNITRTLLYFDNTELPLGQGRPGSRCALFTTPASSRAGKVWPEVVLNAKHMTAAHARGVVEDIERGVASGIRPRHGNTIRASGTGTTTAHVFEEHRYKTSARSCVCSAGHREQEREFASEHTGSRNRGD